MPNQFIDTYLPRNILRNRDKFVSAPRFSTTITRADSGAEQRNQNRLHPLHIFRLPSAAQCHADVEALRDHWMVMAGPLTAFPFRDPMDFASVHLAVANEEPIVSGTDQALGTGDGVTADFQLIKAYARDVNSYSRVISLPVAGSLRIALDGVIQTSGWSVSRPGGVVTFTTPPGAGVAITAGFLFDVPVRFSSDEDFEAVVRMHKVSGKADLELMETRLCI